MALLEDDALRAVDHIGRDLEAAVGRQAVHEHRRRIGERHHRGVDREALERPPARVLVVLLAHRHPRVGVHGVGTAHRLAGPWRQLDRCRAEHVDPLQLGFVGIETRRAAEPDVHAEHRRHLGQRAGDVVVVADIGDGLAGEIAEALLHRQRVGERLQRDATSR